MRPNAEQVEAIQLDAPRVGIRAGAGAGKTGVLVLRYLRHVLQEDIDPEKILTITFTRKAAAEMRARIVQELIAAGREVQAHRAQAGPISTVHSFCERLLREHPFEAGIDPKFEVLSNLGGDDLARDAARAAVASANILSDEAQLFVRSFGSEHKRSGAASESASLITDWITQVVVGFRTAGLEITDLQQLASGQGAVLEKWASYLDQHAGLLLGDTLPENWQQQPRLLKVRLQSRSMPVPAWLAPTKFADQLQSAALTAGLADLAAFAWNHMLKQFDVRRSLDFLQLEALACRIVGENPEMLVGVYEHIIVDEAQDLNPVQHKLIESVPARTLTLVGDSQQAIYAFRGAQSRLFVESLRTCSTKQLSVNFRSTKPIIDAVSHVFGPLWREFAEMEPPSIEEAVGTNVEVWKLPAGPRSAGKVAEGVQQLIHEGVRPGDITVLVRSRTRVSELANGLIERDVPFIIGDASWEYFLRQEIYDVASALLAACSPLDDLAHLSLLRSPLVGISLDGIAAIALEAHQRRVAVSDLLDHIQLDETDRKRLSAFVEWFKPFAIRAPFLQAWQALSELHTAALLDARFSLLPDSEQLIANFRKLLDIALERREMNSIEFASWIESQQRMRTRQSDAASLSSDADAVSIFTVHGAKGLQWKNVILCDASPWTFKSDKRLAMDGKHGILAVSNDSKLLPLVSHLMFHQREQIEAEESKRLLYVGMTRAQERLCLALLEKGGEWQATIEPRLAPRFKPVQNVTLRDFTSPQVPTPAQPDYDPSDPFSMPATPTQSE